MGLHQIQSHKRSAGFRASLDARTDPWLQGHIFEQPGRRSAILPGVATLQMFYDAARQIRGDSELRAFQRVRFGRAVFVTPEEPRQVDIFARLTHVAPSGVRNRGGFPPYYRTRLTLPRSSDDHTDFAKANLDLNPAGSPPPAPQRIAIQPLNGATGFITAADIYHTGAYPNTGMMAMLLSMQLFGHQRALVQLNPRVLESRVGMAHASMATLPLHLELGFTAGGILSTLARSPTESDLVRGLNVLSSVRRIEYFGAPSAGELSFIGVAIGKTEDDTYNFSVANLESGNVYACVEGYKTAFWDDPWKTGQFRTQRGFFRGAQTS